MKNKRLYLFYLLLLSMFVCLGGPFATLGGSREKHPMAGVKQELETHVKFLAHEDRGGRFPGTPGYMATVDYVKKNWSEYGLEAIFTDKKGGPSFLQWVPMRHYIYGNNNSITIKSPRGIQVFRHLQDYFLESPGTGGTRSITGIPAFIGCGIHEVGVWDDLEGMDIHGKPVFLMQFFPPAIAGQEVLPKALRQKYAYGFPSLYKYPAILERGAACIIHVPRRKQVAEWADVSALSQLYSLRPVPPYGAEWQFTPPVPEITASQAMVDYFFADTGFDPIEPKEAYQRKVLEGYDMTIHLEVREERIDSPNLVGLVRGTDPELKNTYIMVGAHLDHLGTFNGEVFNGANDDASGCAALLAVAKELAKNPLKRSVIFALFTGEESCLSGSRYFVENSPVPLKQIKYFINVDEVGGKRGDNSPMGIVVGAFPTVSTTLESIIKDAGKELNKAILTIDTTGPKPYQIYWVDQYSFIKKGVPIISIGTIPDTGADWHTPRDDVGKINFDHLEQVTWYIYRLVVAL